MKHLLMLESICQHFDTDEEIAVLADILLYHVYTVGAVYASDVTDGLTVAMANGDDASFTVTDGTVMILSLIHI